MSCFLFVCFNLIKHQNIKCTVVKCKYWMEFLTFAVVLRFCYHGGGEKLTTAFLRGKLDLYAGGFICSFSVGRG